MNRKLEEYKEAIDQKSRRNIEWLIDDKMQLMKRKRTQHRILKSVTVVFASFALFVAVINTNISAQAFVLENDVLRVLSKPLIFNNIFEETPLEIYTDDVISIEYVLNNFKHATITRDRINHETLEDGFIAVGDQAGTNNSQYLIELDLEYEGMDYPAQAVWKKGQNGLTKVYTYNDELFQYPVLGIEDTVYVMDRYNRDADEVISNAYDAARSVYAVVGDQVNQVYEGEPGAKNFQFYVSNGTPYFIYMIEESKGTVWKTVDLVQGTVHTIDMESSFDMTTGTSITVSGDTVLLKELDRNGASQCGEYFPVKLHVVKDGREVGVYEGCDSRNYRVVGGRFIYGQVLGSESDAMYHIIDMDTQDVYLGSDTTEAYTMLSQSDAMVTVLRISARDHALSLVIASDISGKQDAVEVKEQPKEIILTGDYDGITLHVVDCDTAQQVRYQIQHQD